MKLKKGVILAGLSKVMRPVLMYCEKLWAKHGQELVITAGLDGTHSAGSLHYYGEALDLRTRYFTEEQIGEIVNDLYKYLGPKGYDVVHHKSHIHIEYDKK